MRVRSLFRRLLLRFLDQLSTEQVQDLVMDIFRRRSGCLPEADGLRFLFGLEDEIRREQDRLAILFDNGLHAKHRLMHYHDFFVQRICKSDTVLDFGCGCGAVAFDIAQNTGAEVIGIDLDPGNIAKAMRDFAHPRVRYIVGDGTRVLPDDRIDVVVLSNVLEHLDERPCFLRGLARSLLPRVFLLRVPLFDRDWRIPLRRELQVRWRLDPTHRIEYTSDSFIAEMEQAGLRIDLLEIRWGEIWSELKPEPHVCCD